MSVHNLAEALWLAAQRDRVTVEILADAGSSVPVSADDLDKLAPCPVLARYEELSVVDIQRAELLAIMTSAQRWADQLRTTYSLP